jgi:hypothetical protein
MSNRETRFGIAAAALVVAAFVSGRWTAGDPLLDCRRDIIEARQKREKIRQDSVGTDTARSAKHEQDLALARRRVEELEYICGR